MICKNCGYENEGFLEFCTNCGAPLTEEQAVVAEETAYEENYADFAEAAPAKTTDVLGIVGLVLGALSWVANCCCSWIPIVSYITMVLGPIIAVAAVVVSAIGLVKSKKAGKVSVFAIIGLVLGAVGVLIAIFSLVMGIIGGGMMLAGMLTGSY